MSEATIQRYIKQVRREANEDMKLHLAALNEIHGETLKAINENFVLVNRKLDSHAEMIGELKEDVTDIRNILENDKADKKEVSALAKRVKVLEAARA